MRRLWLSVVVLALGAGIAVAQPAGTPASGPAAITAATDAAQAQLARDVRDRADHAAARAALTRRHADEVAAVERLKQQKGSWRKKRQVEDALAKSNDTAKALATADAAIRALDARIAADRRRVVTAIDAELAKLPDGARKRSLAATRAVNAPVAPVKSHKIIVPDAEIDPLADPEELDQQAQELRASEAELARQVDALDTQTKRLLKAAELRKAHDRAGDLVVRDDDQVRRGGNAIIDRNDTLGVAGDSPDPSPGESPPPPMDDGFHGDQTAQVLAELIDPATGDALRRAGRATDPGTKAEAAKRARDQVAARLEALRKKRAAVEARAKQLRQK